MKSLIAASFFLLFCSFSLTAQIWYPTGVPSVKSKCMDLAVTSINAFVLEKNNLNCGKIKVVASIRNLSKINFTCNPGQASLQLYEEVPGMKPKLVKKVNFTGMAAGTGIPSLIYTRKWCASNKSNPSYRAFIVYESGLFEDGNLLNDDCIKSNNSKKLSVFAINAQFK